MTTAVLFVFGALIGWGVSSTILSVGKPREPVTPALALYVLVVGSLELAALTYLASQL